MTNPVAETPVFPHWIKVWVDGGILMAARNSRKTRGIYWSMRCEDGVTKPTIIRKQDLKHKTNNDAEWLALLEGLVYVAQFHKDMPVVIYSDSQLVVNQFNGVWRAKVHRHHIWRTQAHALKDSLKFLAVQWVPRHVNVEKLGH